MTLIALLDHYELMTRLVQQMMLHDARASDAFEMTVDDDGSDQVTVSFTIDAGRLKG